LHTFLNVFCVLFPLGQYEFLSQTWVATVTLLSVSFLEVVQLFYCTHFWMFLLCFSHWVNMSFFLKHELLIAVKHWSLYASSTYSMILFPYEHGLVNCTHILYLIYLIYKKKRVVLSQEDLS
jgi:hypothetical protein